MAGNSFGAAFRVTTFGESHGPGIGCVVDGCPAGVEVDLDAIQHDLDRRKPGQNALMSQRKESDTVQVLSGVFEGKTTGAPVAFFLPNTDAKPSDYDHLRDTFRPSHADFTYQATYGRRDHRGGGRSSARETAARVAAGALAKLFLDTVGIEVQAYVSQVGTVALSLPYTELDLSLTETNEVRCPDPDTAVRMANLIKTLRKEGNTTGGVVSAVVRGCPAGLGQPVFDKLQADLAKAMLSINAAKGFEYGSGFAGAAMTGLEHNDAFFNDQGVIRTRTNHSGGIQGGLSNGMDLYFRVAFKPVATVLRDQPGVDLQGNAVTVQGRGRHDPCVVPRAVPIVEAMAALTLADHWLRRHQRI